MLEFTYNNWFEYYFDDELFGSQDLKNFKKYSTFYNAKVEGPVNFKEELLKTASHTLDHFGKDLTVLFSGGIDSEIVLRAYLEIGHPVKSVIYRYENDMNKYDVDFALKVCEQLNYTNYDVIDFNVQKFLENDAAPMIGPSEVDKAAGLITNHWLDITEGIPVLAEGDIGPLGMRPSNYAEDKENYYWAFTDWSTDVMREQYLKHINKVCIPKFFLWRPELHLASLENEFVTKLTSFYYKDIFHAQAHKILFYAHYYDDLLPRVKMTGYENLPVELLNEFQKHIDKVNGVGKKHMQPYDRTLKQAINELRGVSRFSRKN